MISKKFTFFLAIFLIFIAMGTVSASDENGTSTSSSTSTNSSKEISINDDNYDIYFDSDGKIKDDSEFEDGDTLFINGTLTNKKLNFDKKIIIDGKKSGKIINSTIKISEDASGSIIKNLIFDNIDKMAINLDGDVSNINIINNIINIRGTSLMSASGNLYGIYSIGAGNFINISNNVINMVGEALRTYGMYIQPDISGGYSNPGMNPMNYIISNNIITGVVDGSGSGGGIWGIQADSIINLTIFKNQLDLKSENFVYGIVVSDLVPSTASVEYTVSNVNISDNIIKGYGKVLYLIELFQLGVYFDNPTMNEMYSIDPDNNGIFTIANNNIYGKGVSVYGIAAYGSRYMNIMGNNITVYGGDYTSVSKGSDVIPTGNNPIILFSRSSATSCNNVNITNNRLETNNGVIVWVNESYLPQNFTHANNLQTFFIDDESYYNFFDNNGDFLANINVTNNDTLRLGNLNKKKFNIDRKLTIIPFNQTSVISFCQIILKDGSSGSLIKDLYMISDSCVLAIDESNDNILENNRIIIMNVGDALYYSVTGISITGDSVRNKILNNNIEMIGNPNPLNSVYFYGISIGSYGYNTINNTISGNKININSGYYSGGISLTGAIGTIVSNNILSLYGKHFVYGIAISDMSAWDYTQKSNKNQIISNNINAKGGMIYLIQSYNSIYNTIKNNNITGDGDAVYGYAAAGALNDLVEGNIMIIKGIDSSKIVNGFDSIGFGHGGIFFIQGSSNITIINNKITSIYKKGGDYGIFINGSDIDSKNTIKNNIITSDNAKKVGKAAIFTDKSSDLISGNTPKKTTLDILTKTIYKGKIATIKAILKDEDGNLVANTKIQLKINGKLYYTTTNSKGVATFKISPLKVGKFRVTANYVGNTALLKSSNTKYQVVKGIPDLIIKKVKKQGNSYQITIKNQGSAKSTISKLKIFYKKNKYKLATVKGINPGKSITLKVKFLKKLANNKYTKIAQINYNKKALESNYNNNKKKFKV